MTHDHQRDGAVAARSAQRNATVTLRWSAAVLSVGTLALLAYCTLVVLVAWMLAGLGEALGLHDGAGPASVVDVVLLAALPGVVGWGVGLAAAMVVGRGETRPPLGGLASGLLGVAAGAGVLWAVGPL